MGRSPCCEKAHTNKGAWTKEEDQRLVAYIKAHGEGCWRSLPKAAGLLRCGKSCRLRWINYLRPDLKRGNFTEEEDDLIIKLHQILGNKWSQIAGRLPGRTDNEIKNYWNTHIKRKLLARGIDPKTHRPLSVTAAAAAAPSSRPEDQPAARSSCSPETSGASNSSDEESGASVPFRCSIDLNLCISQPSQQPSLPSTSSPPARKQETEATSSATAVDASSRSYSDGKKICLCLNRLGLQGGEGCTCGHGGQ
ncbi:hypothetical protein SEVIR_7G295400v4 [Setaria viridis]|uniref:Uncharacterized protein n=1 Tax=Setaria viridis TaxID=4556 RepID=A0A4U6TZV6_SETVI|nr:myb-related protein Zm38-like [Setaria viridis]XP_034602483.1 myb-related protein Zm38-like [Setaria viridis]TKW07244.1 hypothetical protein SEVIR_7G295400v2 [Setaria viridis]